MVSSNYKGDDMQRVVIIGAGYAGICALLELIKNKNIQITLLDKHPYHNLQPEVYDYIANKSSLADVTIDLVSLCHGVNHDHVEFQNQKVARIDFDNTLLYTSEEQTIPYDYLIIAAGARTFFPHQIEGINKANDLKKLNKAMFFKQQYETEIYKKIKDEVKQCDDTHIVVVGAGISGVEIAAEMAYNANKFFKTGQFNCDHLTITLVSSQSSILPGLPQKLINISNSRLKSLGINIMTSSKLTKCDDDYLSFSNGTKINYSFLIFSGGIEGANMLHSLDIEKNDRNQIIVDKYMQIGKYKNVFAVGDAAVIHDAKGKWLYPNVTTARLSGIVAGCNVLNLIDKKKLVSIPKFIEGIMIALGGSYAAGSLFNLFYVKGRVAYYIKHFIFKMYRSPLLKITTRGYYKLKSRYL
jgi:NADH:ubiquinone reductase (H+-translocating)